MKVELEEEPSCDFLLRFQSEVPTAAPTAQLSGDEMPCSSETEILHTPSGVKNMPRKKPVSRASLLVVYPPNQSAELSTVTGYRARKWGCK
jgi:hypothetical protein